MNRAFTAKSIVVVLAVLVLASTGLVGATPPYPTTPATATVDGDPSEWNLLVDFFADMYRAGESEKIVQSKLYLRYDPSTITLYVLVLTEPGYPGLREEDEAWVKINDAKMVDGSYANFEWVEFSPPEANVRGYEASFTLSPGEYTIDVHLNVYADYESQTSRTLKAGLNIFVIPYGSVLAVMGSMFAGLGLIAARAHHKRKKQ